MSSRHAKSAMKSTGSAFKKASKPDTTSQDQLMLQMSLTLSELQQAVRELKDAATNSAS